MVFKGRIKILVRPVAIAGSVVAIVQSTGYFLACLLTCLYHYDVISANVDITENSIANDIYKNFINPTTKSKDDAIIINSTTFAICMIAYVALYFIWIIISSCLIWELARSKTTKNLKLILGSWSTIAIILSILDLVIFILLQIDLGEIKTLTKDINSTYWIVMSIIIRGYALWCANIIFALIFIKFVSDFNKQSSFDSNEIINAYESSRPPDNWLDGNPNSGYNANYDENYATSNSFEALDLNYRPQRRSTSNFHVSPVNDPYNQEQSMNPTYPWLQQSQNNFDERLQYSREVNSNPLSQYPENLTRSNIPPPFPKPNIRPVTSEIKSPEPSARPQRSPPLNNTNGEAPFIPEPDYSPPTSPVPSLRPALRPNSKYAS